MNNNTLNFENNYNCNNNKKIARGPLVIKSLLNHVLIQLLV